MSSSDETGSNASYIDSRTFFRSFLFALGFAWAGGLTISVCVNTYELNTRGFWIRESDETIELLLMENSKLRQDVKAMRNQLRSLNDE